MQSPPFQSLLYFSVGYIYVARNIGKQQVGLGIQTRAGDNFSPNDRA